MKTYIFPILISFIFLITIAGKSQAQIADKINSTAQPLWGPAGYQHADYYYLPDVETYYSVASRQFIYLSGGRWVYCSALPPQYKKYDLYTGYKVVVNRPRPFLNFNEDKVMYDKFKGLKNKQVSIRDAKIGHDNLNTSQPDIMARKSGGDFGPE